MLYKHFVLFYSRVFVHNFLINNVHHSLVPKLVKIDGINCFAAKTFVGKIFLIFSYAFTCYCVKKFHRKFKCFVRCTVAPAILAWVFSKLNNIYLNLKYKYNYFTELKIIWIIACSIISIIKVHIKVKFWALRQILADFFSLYFIAGYF